MAPNPIVLVTTDIRSQMDAGRMTTSELYAYLALARTSGLGTPPSTSQLAVLEREWSLRNPDERSAAMSQVRQWMDDGC